MLKSFFAAAVAALATGALAQTTTDCNPLNVTCPADTALGISNYTWSAAGQPQVDWGVWNNTGGITPTLGGGAVNFTVSQKGNAPGMKSQFYYFFGTVSVIMRAAPGTGIISAVVSLSDDLDEIDWEFKGGNESFVFTNYYGKFYPGMEGNGTDVSLKFDPRADFHNYTTVWTNSTLQWYVDGTLVRQLNAQDAAGGSRFPQTPMRVHVGSWAGGDSDNQYTREWAGGATDYSKGPFDMSVASIYVSDSSSGSTYTYSDHSGSAASIRIAPGNSTIANYLKNPVSQNLSESFNKHVANLSSSAKIGIAIAAVAVAAIGALVMVICCIRQRKAGRQERAIADAEFQKQEAEIMAYRMRNKNNWPGNGQPGQMPGFGYEEFKSNRR